MILILWVKAEREVGSNLRVTYQHIYQLDSPFTHAYPPLAIARTTEHSRRTNSRISNIEFINFTNFSL